MTRTIKILKNRKIKFAILTQVVKELIVIFHTRFVTRTIKILKNRKIKFAILIRIVKELIVILITRFVTRTIKILKNRKINFNIRIVTFKNKRVFVNILGSSVGFSEKINVLNNTKKRKI